LLSFRLAQKTTDSTGNRLHWRESNSVYVYLLHIYVFITRNAAFAFDRLLTKRIGEAEIQSATGGEELELESSNLD